MGENRIGMRWTTSPAYLDHHAAAIKRQCTVRDMLRVAEQCLASEGDRGPFYVSAWKSGKTIALEGPFTTHRAAARSSNVCRRARNEVKPVWEKGA